MPTTIFRWTSPLPALESTGPSTPSSPWTSAPPPAYKEYKSSPGVKRGFCSQCGATISWINEEHTIKGLVEITVGTLDEKWLLGEKEDGQLGQSIKRKAGYGVVLAKPMRQGSEENVIEGVTDMLAAGVGK